MTIISILPRLDFAVRTPSSIIIGVAGRFTGVAAVVFGAEKSDGMIFDGGAGGVGRGVSLVNSGGVNGFGVDPIPPLCFKDSKSDFIVLKVISGGGGGGAIGWLILGAPKFNPLADGGGKLAGGGFCPQGLAWSSFIFIFLILIAHFLISFIIAYRFSAAVADLRFIGE